MADEPSDPGLLFAQIQNPTIVFDPGACLNNDRTRDAARLGQCPVVLWKTCPVQQLVVSRWPGNSLITSGIIEVGMCVNTNGHWRAPCCNRVSVCFQPCVSRTHLDDNGHLHRNRRAHRFFNDLTDLFFFLAIEVEDKLIMHL